jgi:hypothetical protein
MDQSQRYSKILFDLFKEGDQHFGLFRWHLYDVYDDLRYAVNDAEQMGAVAVAGPVEVQYISTPALHRCADLILGLAVCQREIYDKPLTKEADLALRYLDVTGFEVIYNVGISSEVEKQGTSYILHYIVAIVAALRNQTAKILRWKNAAFQKPEHHTHRQFRSNSETTFLEIAMRAEKSEGRAKASSRNFRAF